MPKLILTVGTSFCGKTSWAEDYINCNPNTVILSRDDYRFKGDIDCWDKHNKDLCENEISFKIMNDFMDLLYKDKDIIVCDTNLTWIAREQWIERAYKHDMDLEIVIFKGFVDKLTTDSNLALSLPDYVLKQQYIRFNKFLEEETIPGVTYTLV